MYSEHLRKSGILDQLSRQFLIPISVYLSIYSCTHIDVMKSIKIGTYSTNFWVFILSVPMV